MQVKNYRTKRGYYLAHDTDEKVGGDFSFLILPLYGFDEERFFYVTKLDNGKFEVEGEGYICTDVDSVKRHLQTNRKELQDKSIWYGVSRCHQQPKLVWNLLSYLAVL